jgi:hypothetical protein
MNKFSLLSPKSLSSFNSMQEGEFLLDGELLGDAK